MPHSKRTASGVLGGLLGLVGLSAIAGVLVTATVTPALAVTGAAATGAIDMFNNLPSVLKIDKLILPSTIYYTNDKGKEVELATYYDQDRSPVTFTQIAPVMKDAILSSEDPRYYEHGGIDIIGTSRALLSNLKGGSSKQGGSSISQQYVKNVLIESCNWNAKDDADLNKCWEKATDADGPDGYQRKLQEMRYAVALEQRYSKNEILLGYLNIANFGGTTYGIDAAAEHYFGVSAKKLNLSQAATLAGMVQNPNTYRIDRPGGTKTDRDGNPVNGKDDHYSLTKKRQQYVLTRMLHDGKITKKQYDKAYDKPIKPHITERKTGCTDSDAAYFCAYVEQVLLNDPAFGKDHAARAKLLRKGGLQIHTSLNLDLQKQMAKTQKEWTPAKLDNMHFGAASVSIEAKTGRVLAITQNTKYVRAGKKEPGRTSLVYAGDHQFGGSNGFQAGSTFKLFTLLDWLDQGKSVNQIVDGRRRDIDDWTSHCVPGGSVHTSYNVHNYNKERGKFGTPMQFTKESLNSGFTGMAEQLDLCDIGNIAESLGVKSADGSDLDLTTSSPNPSEIIGVDYVSPMAMAGAYATVVNNGKFCQPRVIDKITDYDGKEIPLPERTCTQVLDKNVAATAAYALKEPMKPGGSGSMGNPNDGTQIIGKTGTHEDEQTWLITSNTKVTTANWVGNVDKGNGKLNTSLAHRSYKWWQLSSLRYPIAKANQAAVDRLYPGGTFPEPDPKLTRRVLVDLPNVVGMSEDDATKAVEGKGFRVKIGKEVDSDLAKGTIAEQSPDAGKVAGGMQVTLHPSNGKGATVPDVTGRTLEEASAILRGAGFTNIHAVCQQNDGGDGRVTTSDPSSGTVTSRGAEVKITYQSDDCDGDHPSRPSPHGDDDDDRGGHRGDHR